LAWFTNRRSPEAKTGWNRGDFGDPANGGYSIAIARTAGSGVLAMDAKSNSGGRILFLIAKALGYQACPPAAGMR
jgi:hypothetical protein